MSEENQGDNQPQASSDNQAGASTDNSPPSPQAVETSPKPEPSYGIEKFSETHPSLEKGIEPLPKPDPSFETHLRSKFSKPVEKRDKLE
ncbi:MAG: hypothetical protein OXG78_10885 [Chloroflexi bacterium]|nr:hypothetical protein [Chloroflexota bacterium]